MEWPIHIEAPGAKTKCEADTDAFFYEQKRTSISPINGMPETPGDMWRRQGWRFSIDPEESPFRVRASWWRWGN